MNLCPKCGADRDLLYEMLQEPPESPNVPLAIAMCENCVTCDVYVVTRGVNEVAAAQAVLAELAGVTQ